MSKELRKIFNETPKDIAVTRLTHFLFLMANLKLTKNPSYPHAALFIVYQELIGLLPQYGVKYHD